MKKLITIRGNSGSGKTTLSRELQHKIGRNTMAISQDMVRRNMLYVKHGRGTLALPLMIDLLKYGNTHSEIVILEGILHSDRYKDLFKTAVDLYDENIHSYYFDLPFEETLKRHMRSDKSSEFGENEMRQWWNEKDYSDILKENTIGKEMTMEDIVNKIISDLFFRKGEK